MSKGMTEEQLKKLRAEVEYPHLELLEPHIVEGLLDEIDRLRAALEREQGKHREALAHERSGRMSAERERDEARKLAEFWCDEAAAVCDPRDPLGGPLPWER